MNNNKEKLIANTLNLLNLKTIKSTALFKESVKNFKLSTERTIFLIFLFILSVFVLMTMVFPHTSAITLISDLTVNINTVIIPIFAVIITGYAIFQALANENTIETLLLVNDKDNVSKFAVYNLYFFGIVCWYLILIILNFILLFMFKYLPKEWSSPFFSNTVNECISAVLISIYFTVIVNFMIEIKSFVYNLFQVFITSATASSIVRIEKQVEVQNNNKVEKSTQNRGNLRKKKKR